jgi:hypothetical protein
MSDVLTNSSAPSVSALISAQVIIEAYCTAASGFSKVPNNNSVSVISPSQS